MRSFRCARCEILSLAVSKIKIKTVGKSLRIISCVIAIKMHLSQDKVLVMRRTVQVKAALGGTKLS